MFYYDPIKLILISMRNLRQKTGFTIVELLIVIVIIAVLASISSVAYAGINNRANESAVVSDFSQFHKTISLWKAQYGLYPINDTELTSAKTKANKPLYSTATNNFIYCRSGSSDSYALIARSSTGKIYQVDWANSQPREAAFAWGTPTAMCTSAGISTVAATIGYYSTPNIWPPWTNGD